MSDVQISPKTREKRQLILRVARKVFADEGFRNTDVQVIADLAQVGKGTVYRYFGSKEQLFLATARASLEELRDWVRQALGSTEVELLPRAGQLGTAEILRRIARSCAEFYGQHPQAVEIMIQERAEFREKVYPSHLLFRAEGRQWLEQLLQAAIERGEIREVDVTEATNALADLIYGSVVNGCLEGCNEGLVDRVMHAIDIFLNGLVICRA